METKDLPRIERLFHDALMLDAAERSAYLARECAGDEGLRAEVESLVAVFERRADFLEKPAFNAGLKALAADTSESLAGKTIGSYKVVRLLGKGGMGEVYLAEDTRLGRQVALKFLARRLAADNWAKRQLIKEARAVAMLDHPNICTVHGLEEADGHSFIVMQYLEGEVLADFICEGRSGAQQALPLALQMVGALAEAHAHGIIHRDIKPRNLMLTAGGQLKVLDFGLAKVIQAKQNVVGDAPSQASQAGLILGTVAYMSPEQLRGERLDFRSDVFSVGTVLYEVVSGKHPFAQGNDAVTIAAILNSQPPALPHSANGSARGLDPVIRRCLEKDKERRYQSASELLLDLQNLDAGVAPRRPRGRLNQFLILTVLVLLFAGALFAYLRLTKAPALAVLPFVNASADPEIDYLIYGLTDSLANQLSRLPQLKVKGSTAVARYKGREDDLQRVGRELDVDAVLAGAAIRQGAGIILQVRLVATADGKQLWAASYDLKSTDALALQAAAAAEVAANLQLRLSGVERKLLGAGQTSKSEAYYEYLRGRYYWNRRGKENIKRAINYFKQAIDLDPAYALAYTGLADSYALLPSVAHGDGQMSTKEAMSSAKAAAKQALAIDAALPEAYTSLGVIKLKYEWDWEGAENEFSRAIALNPDHAPAHYWYSHLLLITGRTSLAVTESETARELDPFSSSVRLHRCRARFQTRQYDSATDCLNKILEEDPDNVNARYVLGFVYLENGKSEEAIRIFKKLHEATPSLAATGLGHAYGRVGKRTEALEILAEMEERSKQTYLPPQEFAIVYIGLGDYDKAFVWLDKAYDERFAYLPYLNIEPLFNLLRADARFASLVKRLKLTP